MTSPASSETSTTTATSSPLYMTRAEIDLRSLYRWMGTKRIDDVDLAMHSVLAETMGVLAPKPFRLMITDGATTGALYGYSETRAEDLAEAITTFADPMHLEIIPPSTLQGKEMRTGFPPGTHLGFEVRIRPVVRHTTRALSAPRAECDAWMHQTYHRGEAPTEALSREEVYAEWLRSRMEEHGGVTVATGRLRLTAFRRTVAHRKSRSKPTEGPDAVIQGQLATGDPDSLDRMLRNGVGRHKAYGYGMVLLRPPR